MKEKIKQNKNLYTAVGLSFLAATVLALITNVPTVGRMMHRSQGFNILLQAKVFFSTLNIGLLTALTLNYLSIYRNLSSRFAKSLTITGFALLIYAITSSPLLHLFLGFKGIGLGPFTFLPDMFVSAAVISLLYQSYK